MGDPIQSLWVGKLGTMLLLRDLDCVKDALCAHLSR